MNLRQLEILREVAATGSLTQAAHRIGVSQPAVSSSISALEADVGFLLFKRTRSGSMLTPEALRLADEAERVLTAARSWRTLASELQHGRVGELHVGCLPGFSPVFMPRLVARFLEANPDVRISLQTHSSERIGQWVAAGHWDVGVMELGEPEPALRSEPFSIPMVCALPLAHPLAERDVIDVADLNNEPLITLSAHHQTTSRLRDIFTHAGMTMLCRVESQLFPPACMLVGEGVGIAVIDSVTAMGYKGRDVVFKPFRPRFDFDLRIVFPRYEIASRQCRLFADHLREALSELLTEFQNDCF